MTKTKVAPFYLGHGVYRHGGTDNTIKHHHYTELCDCSQWKTVSHSVDSCPLTPLNVSGLTRLHEADDDNSQPRRQQHSHSQRSGTETELEAVLDVVVSHKDDDRARGLSSDCLHIHTYAVIN